ncbi:hypothetical protein EST38_g8967 [Candolleomyces aberdarensis]|uniref:Reverse transcriptase Ty1/copia-type domain-containing protein n=1 Tax=Candolleomyces aberdarensis TaxID=2316362 RepID=A0A4Q2DB52_9AGAR|nr:hypothetical protein EST38_g8967 [Candolleomyces aberdarensis]
MTTPSPPHIPSCYPVHYAAGIEDMKLCSADISSAFTNRDSEEVIHMRQPERFHEGGPNLNKKLHSVLLELGFTRLQADRLVYIYAKGKVCIIMPVYIDSITLASKNNTLLDQTVLDLSKHFKLRDLGGTKFLLDVEIIRDCANRSISLSQCQ